MGPLANLLELAAPTVCCACGQPVGVGSVLCDSCAAALAAVRDPRCARCGAPTLYEVHRCRECRGRQLNFERAWAPASYSGPARDLVTALKYRGAFTVAEWMAEMIVAEAPAGIWSGVLVPVPLAALRRFKRGFNQSELLARAIARRKGLRVENCLKRVGHPPTQAGLQRAARLRNPRGSVALRSRTRSQGGAVLIDDVYTTGATLTASAKVLRTAGFSGVNCVTFARTIRN